MTRNVIISIKKYYQEIDQPLSDVVRCSSTLWQFNLYECRIFTRIFLTALTTRQGWICRVDRQTVKFTNTSALWLLSRNPGVLHVMRMRERRSVTCNLRSYVITHHVHTIRAYLTDEKKEPHDFT